MSELIDPIKEAAAVKALRESLATVDAEDDALLMDSIEGETSLFECVDKLLLRIHETRGMADGVGRVIGELEQRQARLQHRVETDRALIEQAMMVAELDKIERPSATLSLTRRAQKVEIGTEADIPAEFWKAGDPRLDKKALLEALKEGRAVPGASLSNGAPSLTVRTL